MLRHPRHERGASTKRSPGIPMARPRELAGKAVLRRKLPRKPLPPDGRATQKLSQKTADGGSPPNAEHHAVPSREPSRTKAHAYVLELLERCRDQTVTLLRRNDADM